MYSQVKYHDYIFLYLTYTYACVVHLRSTFLPLITFFYIIFLNIELSLFCTYNFYIMCSMKQGFFMTYNIYTIVM